MAYNVIATPKFKKQAKRLIKKYASLTNELQELGKELAKNPETGTNLGNNTFKVRLAVKSKGKGKSGGMRVITFHVSENHEVYLLTIYDKSEFANVDDKDLKEQIDEIKQSKL